jgi:hypothetical protein
MAKLLFSLRNVPDEEANGIRQLLDDNQIPYYETNAGNWGISTAGIWLNDGDDLPRARQLVDDFQQQYVAQQKRDYAQQKQAGTQTTFWLLLSRQPLKVILYLALVLAILYISIKPFLSLSP